MLVYQLVISLQQMFFGVDSKQFSTASTFFVCQYLLHLPVPSSSAGAFFVCQYLLRPAALPVAVAQPAVRLQPTVLDDGPLYLSASAFMAPLVAKGLDFSAAASMAFLVAHGFDLSRLKPIETKCFAAHSCHSLAASLVPYNARLSRPIASGGNKTQ